MYNVSRYIDSISSNANADAGPVTSSIHKKQKSRSDTRLVSVLLVTFSMSAKAQIRYASKQTDYCLASRISLASTLQQSLNNQISARTCVLPWYSKF